MPEPTTMVRDYQGREWNIAVQRLSSGYWHIRGEGPCNFAQPPHWPCDEETLRAHTFHEASEGFIQAAIRLAEGAPDA